MRQRELRDCSQLDEFWKGKGAICRIVATTLRRNRGIVAKVNSVARQFVQGSVGRASVSAVPLVAQTSDCQEKRS